MIEIKKNIVSKLTRLLFFILGIGIGLGFVTLIERLVLDNIITVNYKEMWQYWALSIGVILLFGLILFIFAPKLMKSLARFVKFIENELIRRPLPDLVVGSIGLIVGLIIAFLVSRPFSDLGIPFVGTIISTILYIVLGYLGVRLTVGKKQDFINSVHDLDFRKRGKERELPKPDGSPKILDTSVIIDGRIADICEAGFMEGPLVIPEFVLEELQHIADSSDNLKRNRGRRGLDILHKIQKELGLDIIITEESFPEIPEVDSKLLKLTQKMGGKIVTIDYNLNKVASVQGIEVLNINELANAVKPVVIPGENMVVTVVKEGKEANQGLAYLDDGTMIVIENGKKLINQTVEVIVTSVLQTAAGKMIFVRPKN